MIQEVEAARWHKAIMSQVELFWTKLGESPQLWISMDLYRMLYTDMHYRELFRSYREMKYANCPCKVVTDKEGIWFVVGYEGGE